MRVIRRGEAESVWRTRKSLPNEIQDVLDYVWAELRLLEHEGHSVTSHVGEWGRPHTVPTPQGYEYEVILSVSRPESTILYIEAILVLDKRGKPVALTPR